MDQGTYIDEMQARLMSGDLETQIASLEQADGFLKAIARTAVEGFRYTDNPVIYCDRLSAFGQSILPHLETLYVSFGKGEPRTSLAILLLFMGSKTGLSDVLDALSIDDDNQFIASTKLANAGIDEAVVPITNLLRIYALTQPLDWDLGPKIGTLISALRKLGAQVPLDIRERLKGPEVPEHIKRYLN